MLGSYHCHKNMGVFQLQYIRGRIRLVGCLRSAIELCGQSIIIYIHHTKVQKSDTRKELEEVYMEPEEYNIRNSDGHSNC